MIINPNGSKSNFKLVGNSLDGEGKFLNLNHLLLIGKFNGLNYSLKGQVILKHNFGEMHGEFHEIYDDKIKLVGPCKIIYWNGE
jgi:hypothetical protein